MEDGEVKVACRGHLVVILLQFLRRHATHGIFRELIKVVDGLISKDVSIGNKQDSWSTFYSFGIDFVFIRRDSAIFERAQMALASPDVPLRLCQFPADLESRIGLSRSCCHCQQDAVSLLSHSLQHVLDGYLLIIARLTPTATIQGTKIELISPRVLFRESHLPQVLWRWKMVYIILLTRDDIIALAIFHTHVDEPNLIAIGAIGIAYLQSVGIEFGLSHTFRHVFFVALSFNHGQLYTLVFKDIVCLLRILITSSRDATRSNISTLFHQNITPRNYPPTSFP